MRLTFIAPEAMIDDANSLAGCLAYAAADLMTYSEVPQWQDGAGNKYSIASCPVLPGFFTAAYSELERPEWDVESPYLVNLTGAKRAQAVVQLADMTPDAEGNVPVYLASPDKLLVLPGEDALALIASAGVTRIPEPEEAI